MSTCLNTDVLCCLANPAESPEVVVEIRCPFCTLPDAQVASSDAWTLTIRDRFPVSQGHTLVISRRHVASFFDATEEEQFALLRAVRAAKADLDAELHPDGYNVGVNQGVAAGQTVMHLHVHLIPRYAGDVADPRGGVRHLSDPLIPA